MFLWSEMIKACKRTISDAQRTNTVAAIKNTQNNITYNQKPQYIKHK